MEQYLRKPEWLKVPKGRCGTVAQTLDRYHLNSVCDHAGCPNRGECFKNGTATFMLMGNHCTRNCTFCQVVHACPELLDENEPQNVALAAQQMGLRHVVITSVTRDDLPDGGAAHFAKTIRAIRAQNPSTSIEVLIPDFQGNEAALETVLEAEPDILNHNVETVPELYDNVRPQADFEQSLELLARVKQKSGFCFTKSGFMLGLGENERQVLELLSRLREADVDFVTIGQYLQPSKLHHPIIEYVHPDRFEAYKQKALEMGFLSAASGPLVRSSYHAESDFKALKLAKRKDIV